MSKKSRVLQASVFPVLVHRGGCYRGALWNCAGAEPLQSLGRRPEETQGHLDLKGPAGDPVGRKQVFDSASKIWGARKSVKSHANSKP